MITTCFFDLGNVLVDFSHEKMWKQMAKICHIPPQQMRQIGLALWEGYETGALSTEEVLHTIENSCNRPPNRALLVEAAADIFEEKREMTSLVKKLKNHSFQLILISNTCEIHYQYIKKKYRFLDLFDDVVLSYAVKMSKPSSDIFRLALHKANLSSSPHQSLFIDDVALHVAAAQKLGIHGHQFQGLPMLEQELVRLGIQVS